MIDKNAYEYILDEKNSKLAIFPIEHPIIWKKYKDMLAAFWKAEEIDFSNDYDDFLTLNVGEQKFIKQFLAFFANFDGIVNLNLSENFIREIKITEIVVGYQFQVMIENIHGEVYSLMIHNIIKDEEERTRLLDSINTFPAIAKLANWALKWSNSDTHIAYRIVAFIIVEGVFFCGAFASIYWLKYYKSGNKLASDSKNKSFMYGLTLSNMFIQRDETMHYEFGCDIYSMLENKLSFTEVSDMMKEAVTIAQELSNDSLQVDLIGMNKNKMAEYIEFIADSLMQKMNYKKIYNKSNPFPFMNNIGLDTKTNFHEVNPSEYQDSHVNNKSKVFNADNMNEDF